MKKINILLLFALTIVFALFFIGGPGYYSARSYKAFWNFGHILFFALAVYLAFEYFKSFAARSLGFQLVVVIVASLFLGVLIEIFQYGVSRTPDIVDITRNMVGALAAVFWFSPARYTAGNKLVLFSKSAVVIFLVFNFYTVSMMLLDEWRIKSEPPVLSQFNSSLELSRWVGEADFLVVEHPSIRGNFALKVDLGTDQYSGVSLHYFYGNWQGYKGLEFSLFNPGKEDISITVKIFDQLHRDSEQLFTDRFNRTFLVGPGWNAVTVDLAVVEAAPETRSMNMSTIASVGFFTTALDMPKTLYLDAVTLIKATP